MGVIGLLIAFKPSFLRDLWHRWHFCASRHLVLPPLLVSGLVHGISHSHTLLHSLVLLGKVGSAIFLIRICHLVLRILHLAHLSDVCIFKYLISIIFPILDEFSLFLLALLHIHVLLQVLPDFIDDKIVFCISYCLFLFYRSLREK